MPVSQSMLNLCSNQSLSTLFQEIIKNYSVDENEYLKDIIAYVEKSSNQDKLIEQCAHKLVEAVRAQDDSIQMIDALLQEYSLDTKEGILLMCLAEALLRIPDTQTADSLIEDKISVANWQQHVGRSESTLVNASTWGLILTGKVINVDKGIDGTPQSIWRRLIKKSSEPVIRNAMYQAMKIMGKQFVLGQTMNDALEEAKSYIKHGYTYSFDMLGEAAITDKDAQRYYADYKRAIEQVCAANESFNTGVVAPASVSIKLSALHPRYEMSQKERVMDELYHRVLELLIFARAKQVPITIDAEEMDRLELSLMLFEKLYNSLELKGWGGFGLVVQAYSKRALPVLCWLNKLASIQGDVIPVRLVKGAYWDNEIKHAQQLGLSGYPVYTRKEATDTSYIACAHYLFSQAQENLYPQFATHNAHTAATVLTLGEGKKYELQRLHGMGDALYNQIIKKHRAAVRIYAPVGAHKDLLPYLVRRLLENGANSSFVHRLVDAKTPIESLIKNPINTLKSYSTLANSAIALPKDIFAPKRLNSKGMNLFVEQQYRALEKSMSVFQEHKWQAHTVIDGHIQPTKNVHKLLAPQNHHHQVGEVSWATPEQAEKSMTSAAKAFHGWHKTPVKQRADCLRRFADLLEENAPELMVLCAREAGKTLQDSIDEIREAVDFCHYYALEAQEKFSQPMLLASPTGERNELYLEARGVFVCISPWNFPLAIYVGQIMAALVAGNTVVAKPAEQTSLIAAMAHKLMLDAGFPKSVIQFLPGNGSELGHTLLKSPELGGVCFTGSMQVARLINQQLAKREGAILPLIAETGGQNCMLVDSSALPEQVVMDVIHSSFASAGQRCSALRVLYVQEDIVENVKELLKGAMEQLKVGDPALLATDVGPVIDMEAKQVLDAHIQKLKHERRCLIQTPLDEQLVKDGTFVAPSAFVINSIAELDQEYFGPILHLISYKAQDLDKVIAEINESGYGLTLGIQSRSESTSSYIEKEVKVGNCYINRNQIGAVVGVQPFGGRGLSGTGPKAGGPHYLLRFATERTRTINTTAVGGNASLLSLTEQTIKD